MHASGIGARSTLLEYHVRWSLTPALSVNKKVAGLPDNTTMTAVGNHIHEIEKASNATIRKVEGWLELAGVLLADHKTEASN